MGKLTYAEKENLRKAVLTASLQHFTTTQIVDFVHDKLGLEISFDYIAHLRADIKRDATKRFEQLRKDTDLYIYELVLKRIEELENNQRILHAVIERNDDKPEAQIKAVLALNDTGKMLTDCHMSLPNIAKILAAGGANTIFPATENNVTNVNINNAVVTPNPNSPTESFYCDSCQKKHDYAAQCPQRVFGDGDKWCDKCQRVHYNNRTCADDAMENNNNNKTYFCTACQKTHEGEFGDNCAAWQC